MKLIVIFHLLPSRYPLSYITISAKKLVSVFSDPAIKDAASIFVLCVIVYHAFSRFSSPFIYINYRQK